MTWRPDEQTFDEGFHCWAEELAEQVADDADDPRERIEAEDFISRHHDLYPFTPAGTRVAEFGGWRG